MLPQLYSAYRDVRKKFIQIPKEICYKGITKTSGVEIVRIFDDNLSEKCSEKAYQVPKETIFKKFSTH